MARSVKRFTKFFSAKMVYKKVKAWTLGQSLSVLNFTEYHPRNDTQEHTKPGYQLIGGTYLCRELIHLLTHPKTKQPSNYKNMSS